MLAHSRLTDTSEMPSLLETFRNDIGREIGTDCKGEIVETTFEKIVLTAFSGVLFPPGMRVMTKLHYFLAYNPIGDGILKCNLHLTSR
jgi:hypothetical protein